MKSEESNGFYTLGFFTLRFSFLPLLGGLEGGLS